MHVNMLYYLLKSTREKGGENMNLIRWDPFRELMGMRQAMDRLLDGGLPRPLRAITPLVEWAHPALDVYQTPKEVIVKASLPGIKPEDVEVAITDDTLTIKGETRAEEKVDEEDYICRECHYGSYLRSITIPHALKTDAAKAHFEDGILTLTIPRAEVAKPKKIEVKAKRAIEGGRKGTATAGKKKTSKKEA
jgi:HSP20 family protein